MTTQTQLQKPSFVLELEDGQVFNGTGFGANSAVGGEVVFNTGMSGYIETLTDPSYRGQILVLTYPLIGNYGVPAPRSRNTIDGPYESLKIQVQGLIVQNYVPHYSHYTADRSLGEWLTSEDVPAVSGIDTRTLTRHLREKGTMQGRLLPGQTDKENTQEKTVTIDMHEDVFKLVAPNEAVYYEGGELEIMLIDVGAKDNIVRSLLTRGANVNRVPWHDDLKRHSVKADGIIIGNGPGDPKDLNHLIEQVRHLLDNFGKPIFGICLGNQILSLAAGADTYKLPYGHRSVNQPVQDLLSRRCYITSQNHGYAVREESLPIGWESWFVNINDGSNEGVRCRHQPFFSVQFHPEAHPGPGDTGYLFDDFLRLAGSMRRN